MGYLAFRYTKDDQGNDLLKEITLYDDFINKEEVLVWLATLEGGFSGTRYLVVAAESWVTATIKEKPVTRYAHIDGCDDATLMRRKNEENKLKQDEQWTAADIKTIKDLAL